MGHSAGGHIAMVFGFSRLIDPERQLINRIVVISPVPSYDMPELLIKNCYELASRVGCYTPNITSDSEIVECLRLKDSHELISMQRLMEDDLVFFWNFMAGEPFMHLNQSIADFKKNAVKREMYIGNTIDENGFPWREKEKPSIAGSFMDWENPYEVADKFDEYHDNAPLGTVYESFTQGIFVSVATYSQAQVNAGGKVFLFQSKYVTVSDSLSKSFNLSNRPSNHVSDMQYFVGTHREEVHTPDMDVIDTFYSRMIVNFTKYGNPSPVWKPLDPSKMNYYALEVNTEKQIWPRMEEGFHESDVNFWFINMTAFDREVTRQKQLLSRLPMYPGPVILPPNESSPSDVSAHWWFYALIVVVALIIFYLIYVLKRAILKTPETTPLLYK
uniref:COesterase domain-containing protein n=1 Tax=Caenorhabditis tropicalis TaxID=1561998 RepID=A0A1I7TZ53_9PELO